MNDFDVKLKLSTVESSEFEVVDEHDNAVGMLVPGPERYIVSLDSLAASFPGSQYPIPGSKQAKVASDWLKEHFEENIMTSVPRCELFEEYLGYCCDHNSKPFNQAVFGKIVRACFPNLSTRRLGVRGHSRYHYAGLNVKEKSIYSNRFSCDLKKYNFHRINNLYGSPRQCSLKNPSFNSDVKKCKKSGYRLDTASLFIPPYPTIDELFMCSEYTRYQMSTFLGFYRCYNKQLLKFIINLDFEKTYNHICNLVYFVPDECRVMFQTNFICDVMVLYDDIMYQEASKALVPDPLASLGKEFSVTVRKFAKTIPSWIAEGSKCEMLSKSKMTEKRIQIAKQWSEYIRRVTTLCHVTKEARKTLVYPTIVLPLLVDLRSIPIREIAGQCAFAGNNEFTDVTTECFYAEFYMKRFCDLLQNEVSVETYASELELLINKHAGLKEESGLENGKGLNINCYFSTDQTRKFLMKWATYGSKILAEITLKSSESVGPFHLVTLLFGDYINHVISLKNEEAKRMKRLQAVIREDSSFFERFCFSNDESARKCGSSKQSTCKRSRTAQQSKSTPVSLKQDASYSDYFLASCSSATESKCDISGCRNVFVSNCFDLTTVINETIQPIFSEPVKQEQTGITGSQDTEIKVFYTTAFAQR